MLATIPNDANFQEQLKMECDHIRKECPHFLKYLEMSVEATAQACDYEMRPAWLMKHSGASADLRRILSVIADPLASVVPAQPGMDGR